MTIPPGHRFEATQALRQVLARAVNWGLLHVNPAKLGVENPQRRYTEDEVPPNPHCPLVFPSVRGGHLDLHNFRNRAWKPAQRAAG